LTSGILCGIMGYETEEIYEKILAKGLDRRQNL